MTRSQLRTAVRYRGRHRRAVRDAARLVIGLFFGWALVQALKSNGIDRLTVPLDRSPRWSFVAALAGVTAAVWPGRRASRLDVLKAIATE